MPERSNYIRAQDCNLPIVDPAFLRAKRKSRGSEVVHIWSLARINGQSVLSSDARTRELLAGESYIFVSTASCLLVRDHRPHVT